jgi:para-aminobenzoate synthetase component I
VESRINPRTVRRSPDGSAVAYLGGRMATGLRDVTADPAVLDSAGFWAVVGTFEGEWTFARFDEVGPRGLPPQAGPWLGPDRAAWKSSMDRNAYVSAVEAIRREIAAGEVYQSNLCRVLSAPVDADVQPIALAARLSTGNPAPYSGVIDVPRLGMRVVTASPELYLRRSGRVVTSEPIKGTGRTEADLQPKDWAENVMIVDLVRNDLARVAAVGSVAVPELCRVEEHPGLVHLVSTVTAELACGAGWPELLAASFPPGSVTGAPKSSALRIIRELEPVPRGPYCGAVGWVDADRRTAELAVGIRTFWWAGGEIRFGTGAGITWGSDPQGEWEETELKAARLLAVASSPPSSEDLTEDPTKGTPRV